MEKAQLDRISELARKEKETELTEEEKKEQQQLREQYIKAIRGNLEYQLQELRREKE